MQRPKAAVASAAGAKYFCGGGFRGPLKAPGNFFICRCSEMHSPAFSEQLTEHYFHCKFI